MIEPRMRIPSFIEGGRGGAVEIHHRNLGFMQVDEGRIGEVKHFSKKGTSNEVLVDYSKINSKVSSKTLVKNVGKDSSSKSKLEGVITAATAETVKDRLETSIKRLADSDKYHDINSIPGVYGTHTISEVGYAMLKGLPKAFEEALARETTVDQIVSKLKKASFYEYKQENPNDLIDHSQYNNWKVSGKTLEERGFSIQKTIKEVDGILWCELRLVAPKETSRSLCAEQPIKTEQYSNKLDGLVLGEFEVDKVTADKINSPEGIRDIIAKGNPKDFIGHNGIDSSTLEAHLVAKEQLEEAGQGLSSIVTRIGKEFREDFITSGYNFFKLRGLSIRKKFDMILVGLGKFIPDYLTFFRREVPPASAGAVAIMLIPAILIGIPFAIVNFFFRLAKPIFAFIAYGFFTMLGHPTFSAVPYSPNKGWLRFTGVIKWALIAILAAPVGLIMIAYKLAGCKLSTREVARAGGIDTEGVYTSNDMQADTINKYKDYPRLSKFFNLYKIIPTVGVGIVAISIIIALSLFFNPVGLAIIAAILLPVLGTTWYTEIYKKQSKDSNVLFTLENNRMVLNSKNRFGAYILAEMEQILSKNRSATITSDDVFKAFLDCVALNKDPEFIGALNEFLDFYKLLLSELSMDDLSLVRKCFGDSVTEEDIPNLIESMTELVQGLRICVLRKKDDVLKYDYNEQEKVRGRLKDLESNSIENMKHMLAYSYNDFQDNPPNVNFSLYLKADNIFATSNKFKGYDDVRRKQDSNRVKPEEEYLRLKHKFNEAARYPTRFSEFGVENYHYRDRLQG